jgi:hypothetical protein
MDLLNGSSSTIREGTRPIMKGPNRFYWHRVVMRFIEGELFHDKRKKLTVLERFPVHFFDMTI